MPPTWDDLFQAFRHALETSSQGGGPTRPNPNSDTGAPVGRAIDHQHPEYSLPQSRPHSSSSTPAMLQQSGAMIRQWLASGPDHLRWVANSAVSSAVTHPIAVAAAVAAAVVAFRSREAAKLWLATRLCQPLHGTLHSANHHRTNDQISLSLLTFLYNRIDVMLTIVPLIHLASAFPFAAPYNSDAFRFYPLPIVMI